MYFNVLYLIEGSGDVKKRTLIERSQSCMSLKLCFMFYASKKFINHYISDVGQPHTFSTKAKISSKNCFSKSSVQLKWGDSKSPEK